MDETKSRASNLQGKGQDTSVLDKEKQDLKTEATKAALQLTQLGYKCKRNPSKSEWDVTNPVGQRYDRKVPDAGMMELLAKVQVKNGDYDIPDDPEADPNVAGSEIPDPNAEVELPTQADGSVRAEDIPLFQRNPELKKALAASVEPVTVDKNGNIHLGGFEIKDDGDHEDAQESLTFIENTLQKCVADENMPGIKELFKQMEEKGYTLKAYKEM